jgi:hypothetical protein
MDVTGWLLLAAVVLVPALLLALAIRSLGRRFFPRRAALAKLGYTGPAATVIWVTVLFAAIASLRVGAPPKGDGSPLPFPLPRPAPSPPRLQLFPWPPPAPSTFAVISSERILNSGALARAPTFSGIDSGLRSALRAAGGAEASYYAVPQGYAMVTRLESIESNGALKPEAERWGQSSLLPSDFSLVSYLKLLFLAPQGHYRLIVFVVTAESFSGTKTDVTSDEARMWLTYGENLLPAEVGQNSSDLRVQEGQQ